jgi:MFS family permease
MWWHLRNGQEMLARGQILTTDAFSYTRAGAAWTNAFWLTDILLYLIWRAAGFFGLAFFAAGMNALTMFVLTRQMRGAAILRAGLVVFGAIAVSIFWAPRPQLISFLFIVLLNGWLTNWKTSTRKPFWALIPFFALWANLHGGYFWGILLLLAVLAGEALQNLFAPREPSYSWKDLRNLALVTLGCWLAALLTPNGIAMWKLPFYTVNVSLAIQEWLSPDFHRIDLQPVLALTFGLIAAVGLSRQRLAWADLFKAAGFGWLAFVAVRGVPLFVLATLPVLSLHLDDAFNAWTETPLGQQFREATGRAQKTPPENLGLAINILVITLLAATALLRTFTISLPAEVEKDYPAGAVAWIKENQPQGRLFNSYNWGGYLDWNLPRYPVFIDGRADLFGDELISTWQATAGGDPSALDKWDVNLVLIEPHWPLARVLQADGWQVLYQDEKSILLGR